jgi:hypothetical protein
MGQPSHESVVAHWSKLIENFETSSTEFYTSVERALDSRRVPGLQTSRVTWSEGGLLAPDRIYLRVTGNRHVFDICAAPFGTGYFFSSWVTKNKGRFIVLYWLAFAVLTILIWWLLQATLVPTPQFSTGLVGFMIRVFLASPFVLLPLAFFMVLAGIAASARRGMYDPEAAIMAVPFLGAFYQRIFAPETYYRIDTMLMFQSAVQAAVLEVIDGLTTQKGLRRLGDDERKPIFHNLC